MKDALATYIEDHLAGASLAVGLLESLKARHEDEPLSAFAANVLPHVQLDVTLLEDLLDSLGARRSVAKDVVAWFGDRAGRIKVSVAGTDPLGTFEALEFLALGIQGKMSLWHAFQVLAPHEPRLKDCDLNDLLARAQQQYDMVEERRLQLAPAAFVAAKA